MASKASRPGIMTDLVRHTWRHRVGGVGLGRGGVEWGGGGGGVGWGWGWGWSGVGGVGWGVWGGGGRSPNPSLGLGVVRFGRLGITCPWPPPSPPVALCGAPRDPVQVKGLYAKDGEGAAKSKLADKVDAFDWYVSSAPGPHEHQPHMRIILSSIPSPRGTTRSLMQDGPRCRRCGSHYRLRCPRPRAHHWGCHRGRRGRGCGCGRGCCRRHHPRHLLCLLRPRLRRRHAGEGGLRTMCCLQGPAAVKSPARPAVTRSNVIHMSPHCASCVRSSPPPPHPPHTLLG
jgi:hypothetical protein